MNNQGPSNVFYENINKKFLLLLWIHLPIALLVAHLSGQSLQQALLFSIFINSVPTLLFIKARESLELSISLAMALMCYSALLIHLSRGMTEMHFHVFSSLGVLITLAQPLASIAALATVAVHHLAFYFLLPSSLLNYEAGLPILGIHVLFALATGIPAILISQRYKLYIVSVKNIIDEVQIISDSVASDASKMLKSANDISESTATEARSIQETAAAINQLNSIISQNAESAQQSALGASSSLTKSTQGKKSMHEMVTSMSEIKLSNQDVSEVIESSQKELGVILSTMKKVTEKTNLINEIVFQTKILSFNASVEAARAGENGKGFAIVAEEVGKLAQMSGEASKEINEILLFGLNTIENSIDKTKTSFEKITTQFSQRINKGFHTAEDCQQILQAIDLSINEITSMSDQISSACHEQSIGVKEISNAMSLIDSTVQENKVVANQAAGFANSLEENSEKLTNSVQKLIRAIA
jgi:methyl-accepting chemotaxis protein